jgi:eukaryotic-like serine/threonine-protein kinase
VRFSRDGSHIYYSHTEPASSPSSREYDLYRIPILGGSPQLLVKDVDTTPSFSPDGQRMAYLRANDPEPGKYFVLVANADGSEEKTLTTGTMQKNLIDLSWSPDGKTIAGITFGASQNGSSQNGSPQNVIMQVVSIDAASGNEHTIAQPPYLVYNNLAWLPDGKALAVIYNGPETNFARKQVGLIDTRDGKFHPITADTNDYANLSVSTDGSSIATIMRESIRDVYLSSGQKADYSDARQISSGDAVSDISWTNDGKLLAGEFSTIHILDSSGAVKSEIGERNNAAFEPHGCGQDKIVFTSGNLKTISINIWRANADGSGMHQVTDGKNEQSAECSPDGKTVFYIDSINSAFMKVPIDGGKPERVFPGIAEVNANFDISRDGKTALLGTYDFKAQRPNFTLLSLESGQVLRVFDYDSHHEGKLRLSPDGKGIVYPIREKGVDNLWLQPVDGSAGRQITNFTALNIYSYEWSPDGKSLALVRGSSPSDVVLIQDSQKK